MVFNRMVPSKLTCICLHQKNFYSVLDMKTGNIDRHGRDQGWTKNYINTKLEPGFYIHVISWSGIHMGHMSLLWLNKLSN